MNLLPPFFDSSTTVGLDLCLEGLNSTNISLINGMFDLRKIFVIFDLISHPEIGVTAKMPILDHVELSENVTPLIPVVMHRAMLWGFGVSGI